MGGNDKNYQSEDETRDLGLVYRAVLIGIAVVGTKAAGRPPEGSVLCFPDVADASIVTTIARYDGVNANAVERILSTLCQSRKIWMDSGRIGVSAPIGDPAKEAQAARKILDVIATMRCVGAS
jgi:hypothetical protein